MIEKYKRILSGLLVLVLMLVQSNLTCAGTIYKDGDKSIWEST